MSTILEYLERRNAERKEIDDKIQAKNDEKARKKAEQEARQLSALQRYAEDYKEIGSVDPAASTFWAKSSKNVKDPKGADEFNKNSSTSKDKDKKSN